MLSIDERGSMANTVGVAKAAKLLGISRVKLQNMIRGGDLQTFEGLVDLDELKRCFPALAINTSPMLERTQIIRDSAYAKRVQQHLLPQDSLQKQIRRLKVDLSVQKTMARDYQKLFNDLLATLGELQQSQDEASKKIVVQLNLWLLSRIEDKNKP